MRRLSGGSVFDHNKIYHTSIETVKQAAAPYRAGPGCFLFGSLADSLCSGFCRCGFPLADAVPVDGIEDGIKDQEKKETESQNLQDVDNHIQDRVHVGKESLKHGYSSHIGYSH